jgi:hypothetical protein
VPDRRVISTSTVSLFYALLAIVANVAVVGIVVAALTGRLGALADLLSGTALTGAFLVALLATAGSLYFSEVAHYEPCTLCWYQRIAMYPLAVVLPVAAWRRDHGLRLYAALVAVGGLAVSAWHNYIETFPHRDPGGCDPTNPCTIRWVEGLGFWTIPRMALACFAMILALLALDRPTLETSA